MSEKDEKKTTRKPASKSKTTDPVKKYKEQEDKIISSIVIEGDDDYIDAKKAAKKGKKPEKLISAKKLPGILKKNYKAEKIEKALFKKIYIPSDLELLKTYIKDNPEKPGFVFIPKDTMIPCKEFKRLKLIAKDVKKNKASFKLIPFAAVACFIAAVVIVFVTFKDVFAKKGLVAGMQKAFGARTDVSRVHVELFGAKIRVENLQQANKDSPMKNLFQFDLAEIDFNLTEALRGKFDAQNIQVSGFAVNTDRKYSGELPAVQKVIAEKTASKEDKAFNEGLASKKEAALLAAENSIKGLFADYNPETIISNVKDNLKSPEVAKKVQSEVEATVKKWEGKPSEVEKEVNDFSSSVNEIMNTDWSKVNDPIKIKKTIENLTDAIQRGKKVSEEVQSLAKDVKADSAKIKSISDEVTKAIDADTKLVNTELDKIKSFNLEAGTKILGNTLDSVLYSVIGKYYPYVKKAVASAKSAKSSSSGAKQKKAKVKAKKHQRLPGTNVYYRKDRVPQFLIEKISFDGLGFEAKGFEISNDMDKRGEPASGSGKCVIGNQTHKANVIVDARTQTENPLAQIDYSGDNYNFAFENPYLNLSSSTTVTANGAVADDGTVDVIAVLDLGKLKLTADKFEPEFAYNLYSDALSSIKRLSLKVGIEWQEEKGLSLTVNSDLDKQFGTILKSLMNKQLDSIKKQARAQIGDVLKNQTGGVSQQLSEFIDIEKGINAQSVNMSALNKKLDSKKAELQKQLEDQAKSAAGDALKDIPIPGGSSGSSDAAEKAGNMLKGLFGN